MARRPMSQERSDEPTRAWPLLLAAGILLAGCGGGGRPAQDGHTQPKPERPAPPPPPKGGPVMTGVRWESRAMLSEGAVHVLKGAFDRDYAPGGGLANAYDFAAHGGHKGMDWWNFPWDLPSSRPEYLITYEDMRALLEQVEVRSDPNNTQRVRYSAKLAAMVDQLTPEIMNAHGGILRVVKILYCVRNFLAVAQKYNLQEDLPPLRRAAEKLLAIHATGRLVDGHSPYGIHSTYAPKDLEGKPEDRTKEKGVQALRDLKAN